MSALLPSPASPLPAARAPLPLRSPAPRLAPPVSPAAMVRTLFAHRYLIWQMARREVVGRYRGSLLGLLWSFFHPLLMLAVYTFAFAYVLHASPRPVATAPANAALAPAMSSFALYAFSGLILFNLFAEAVTRAPVCILQNATYVKKVVFPLEILPFVYLVAGLIHAAISTFVLLLATLIVAHSLPITALLAPLAVFPLLLVILGAGWFLASLGVYLRDVGHIIGIVTMVMMWLAPVFYSTDQLSNPLIRELLRLNPLTIPMEAFRDLILYGQSPNWWLLGIYTLLATLLAWLGFVFFQRTKRGFADVV